MRRSNAKSQCEKPNHITHFKEAKPVRGKELDFVDSLIVNKSCFFAENNGATHFYFCSFDKAVTQLKSTRKQ